LAKIDQPPIQHLHVLRWYNQVSHECGPKETGKAKPEVPKSAPVKSDGGHSKDVDPTILPKSTVQRDAKTGQMKGNIFKMMVKNQNFWSKIKNLVKNKIKMGQK